MDFLKKIDENPYENLYWNIPEQPLGAVNVIGGNSQNFRTPVKITEFLTEKYPLKELHLVLPDSLSSKLPPLPNLVFLDSTEAGSFGDERALAETINAADFNLIIGDLSKNSITSKVLRSASELSEKPTLLTRDAVDLIATDGVDRILMNENLILFGSMAQLQKLFRAAYYPKVLLLSQPLNQVAEALHKFTLSYPVSIITLHSGQILVAKNGNVVAVQIEKSGYSPITIWSGELAAKIIALNLYNPNNFVEATVAAIF